MINYIVQVLLFQTVFLAVYDLILKKETFFQWNRVYLIITSILAYVIPLIRFTGASSNIPQEYRIMLPEVMLSPETFIETQVENATVLFDGIQWVFIIGMLIAGILFTYKLVHIFRLISQNRKEKNKDYSLVLLANDHTAFSFFKYIFLGNTTVQKEEIIKHELIHVKQKHSIDLLFFELQKILLWFNPYSYLYQKRIAEIHEFIADLKTVNKKEKSTFYNSLLAETFRVDKMAFVNSFNKQSIIKKRIIMFSKKKSKEILKFKYLLLIPVLMGMLIYSSCESQNKENQLRDIKIYKGNEATVVKENEKGYFDYYLETERPDGETISYKNLSSNEKEEYNELTSSPFLDFSKSEDIYEIIQLNNGNKVIYRNVKLVNVEGLSKSKNTYSVNLNFNVENKDAIGFAQIDQVPIYPGCEDTKDQKKCLVQKIMSHVSDNFDFSVSKNLGLEAGKKKVYVQFKIDKTGAVVDVRARAPHKELEKEAIRVVSSLPKMKPGEENGKKVAVKYTLPITFVVD